MPVFLYSQVNEIITHFYTDLQFRINCMWTILAILTLWRWNWTFK